VVQVLVSDVGFPALEILRVLLWVDALDVLVLILLLHQLQLPGFFVHEKLLACKDHSLVWLQRLVSQHLLGQLKRRDF
jgi:hypothetical protein